MRIKNTFLAFSLLILLGASALAQSGETVSIQIIDTTGKVVATKTVAPDGSFNFDNLPSGDYRLKIKASSGGGAAAASYAATGRMSTNVTTPKQTQGATFGEKVNSGLQAAGNAKATSENNHATSESNEKRVNKIEAITVKQKIAADKGETERKGFTIKMQMLNAAQFLKVEKATSGLKDTLKTQVRTASPGAVTVESWSWGTTPNTIEYTTANENKLQEGVDAFIKVGEQKSVSGKLYLAPVSQLK